MTRKDDSISLRPQPTATKRSNVKVLDLAVLRKTSVSENFAVKKL